MRIYLLSLFLLAHTSLLAQTDVDAEPKSLGKNIAYLEAGGVSLFYSLNYQRNIRLSDKLDLGAGISVSPAYYPSFNAGSEAGRFSPRASLLAQAIYKIDRHEIGLGASWGYYTWHLRETYGNGSRYQQILSYSVAQLGYGYTLNNGVYLGAYYTPSIMDAGDFDFHHWTGFRVGYRF